MTSLLKDLQVKLADPSIDYQTILIGVVLVVSIFEGYIGSRQKPYLLSSIHPTLPNSLQPYLPKESGQETYEKSQSYALDKHKFSTVVSKIDLIQTFLLLSTILAPVFSNLLPGISSTPKEIKAPFFGKGSQHEWTLLKGFWDISENVLPSNMRTEIKISMMFVAILSILGTILGLPQSYYKNFVLEEKHGFNKMTRATFFADAAKGLVLSLVIELPLIAGMIRIIHWVGSDGILKIVAWLMVFLFSIQIIMIPLYPYVIAPLFNKFTPLDEAHAVFPKVKDLATKLNFPLGRVWVMDGSKRSAHSNAFFFGLPFLTKHIVIYDTLLEKSTPEEVEAILAHELGHWAGKHVLILLSTSLIQTAFSLSTFTLFLSNPTLLKSFGFDSTSKGGPVIISLFLAAALFAPLSAILQFSTNTITRALEYQADEFAFKLGESYAKNLKGALVSIHEKNLAVYGVDHIYSAYNHNHPTLIERLDALDSAIAKGGKANDSRAKKEL